MRGRTSTGSRTRASPSGTRSDAEAVRSESPGEAAGHHVRVAALGREALVLGAHLERAEAVHEAAAAGGADAVTVDGERMGERRTHAAPRAGADDRSRRGVEPGEPRLQVEVDDRCRQIENAERALALAARAVGERHVGILVDRRPARMTEVEVL